MAGTQETNCPNCGRHCSAEDLHCPRGRAYFGAEVSDHQGERRRENGFRGHGGHHRGDPNMTIDDKVIQLMRAAGHHLHHGDSGKLTAALTDDEKRTLIELIKKCLKGLEK